MRHFEKDMPPSMFLKMLAFCFYDVLQVQVVLCAEGSKIYMADYG
jgi:hypothetical protein